MFYERSESILAVAFDFAFSLFKSYLLFEKLPQRIERKRDSIEFERSENQGQFL
jgi:hypothetical protein